MREGGGHQYLAHPWVRGWLYGPANFIFTSIGFSLRKVYFFQNKIIPFALLEYRYCIILCSRQWAP